MQVHELMTDRIEAIPHDASLQDAARAMRDQDVGLLAAVSAEGGIVGLITDRDLVVRGMAEMKDPQATRIEGVLTRAVCTIATKASRDEAALAMKQNKVRRLIVVDDEQRAVGVVSLGDLAIADAEPIAAGEVLAACAGAQPAG